MQRNGTGNLNRMEDDAATETTSGEFSDVPESLEPSDPSPRWPWIVASILILLGIAVAIAWPIEVPYYTLSPGPVYDTSDFVHVKDGVVSEDGELLFLTVSLLEANVFEYTAGMIDPKVEVRARERIRPIGVSQEQLKREGLAAMQQSKTDAIYVALTSLGYEVTLIGTGALVIDTVPDSGADGVLLPNDVIVEMDGKVVAFRDDIIKDLEDAEIGDLIDFLVKRPIEGEVDAFNTMFVEVELGPHVDDPTRPMIGVLLDNNAPIIEFPVEVIIDSQNIGGPSAGLMFTLQIIDQLTEGELTNGERIAGTGTISRDASVGAIGGITQKVYGAIDAGARAVLVPAKNYDDAVLAAKGDIEVVRVETVDDALTFLATL
ncbi:Lon-like protease with PDZ domain [hydrothermal vent metagenome]|uniref:Lon-like protease with PDZ domain n=1 Tax=hydrothermal vent metagenome TaxID=652676 RepID=A0A3B0T342_9ZZZZ